MTLNIVLYELPAIPVPVCPNEFTLTLLDAFIILTLEATAIWPAFNTSAVLAVVRPIPPIERAILMVVETNTMGFVIEPAPLINIAIFVEQTAIKICFIILPVALIETAIGPDLHATAFTHV